MRSSHRPPRPLRRTSRRSGSGTVHGHGDDGSARARLQLGLLQERGLRGRGGQRAGPGADLDAGGPGAQEKGRGNTLLIDAGDTIQGTPLTYYCARVDPITAANGPVHPMAQAMNAIGYDAAALGNHEFNYGIDTLRKFESQLRFPLLGANAVNARRSSRRSVRT